MTSNSQARASSRYRKRQQLTTGAELNGAEVIDSALVARMADGHYVVAMYDGKSLHLVPRDGENVDAKLDHIIELLAADKGEPARIERAPKPVATEKPARKPNIRIPSALTAHDDPKVRFPQAGTAWNQARTVMQSDAAKDHSVEELVVKLTDYVVGFLKYDTFDRAKFAAQLTAMINALRELHGDDWAGHIPAWKFSD